MQSEESLPPPPIEALAHHGPGLMVETILKHPERMVRELRGPRAARAIGVLFALGVAAYLLYGLLVGSFSGGAQWWAAPLKIAGGMVFSSLICLPSLYIFACLARSDSGLRECLGLQAGLLALSGILLIGFLPVAWVFSSSIEALPFMGFLHLMFWFVAFNFGARFLRAGMKDFGAEVLSPVRVWTFMFFIVCLQMTSTLRPLLGEADAFFPVAKRFFTTHWFEVIGNG
jgi:hypothetical protein